jgi:hypothetical protein
MSLTFTQQVSHVDHQPGWLEDAACSAARNASRFSLDILKEQGVGMKLTSRIYEDEAALEPSVQQNVLS